MENWKLLTGDCDSVLDTLDRASIQSVITSPPYWQLRDYGTPGELGQEETPEAYIERLTGIFRKLKDVLRSDGTVWLNLGDTYCGGGGYCPNAPSNRAGSKQSTNRGVMAKKRPIPAGYKAKDLVGLPWMVALALRKDGWYLRADVVWEKTNGMPEPVKDRPNRIHEYVFLLSKSKKYYYNPAAVKEDACDGTKRHRRSVWHLPIGTCSGIHTAVFPPSLVELCLLSSTKENDVVLDPFAGSATTGTTAIAHNRKFVGIELSPDYCKLAVSRLTAAESRMKA
jgi:DNA modification methylase